MRKFTLLLVLMLFCGVQVMLAQSTVTGRVTSSEDGTGIPGVSVAVKGTTTGTTTDINGNYSLSVPSTASVLQFYFMGMRTQEITVGTQSIINVVMEPSVAQIEGVVVTALGIKREKRETPYQTQTVANEELAKNTPLRAASALAGKVAGLQINVQDNGVNPSNQILLRGLRSISGNNSALIVIDGAIASQGAFDDLNPNDIADINVLKGATAAALYGSDAGNGALIVTTKAGRISQNFTVGLNSAYTAEKVAYMPDFQTEYGTGWEGAYDNVENTNWGPRFDGTLRQIGPTFPEGYGLETQFVPYAPVKDNLLNFFNTGNSFVNDVYFSGGNESSKYYLSFGDQRSSGIIPDDTYRRNTFRVNASKKLGKVELSANTSYFNDKTDIVGTTIGDQDRPLYWFILNTSANIPLSEYRDWSNPLSYGYADNYYNAYYQNPYWAIGTNRNGYSSNRLNGILTLSWDIFDWLSLTGRTSANNVWGNGKNWRASQTYNPELQPSAGAVSSFVTDNEYQSLSFNNDALLNAEFDITNDISLKTVLGGTVYSYEYRQSDMRANNLSIPGFYDISNGTGKLVGSVDQSRERNFGFFGDLLLGYKNFLFLNFSGRNDWTSTLAKGNNSYFYPAAGLSLVLTDAIPSLKANNFLSYTKLTLSNSTVYNDLNPYQINERYYQHSAYPFGTINGFYLDPTAVDANITKEKINTTELGLNMAFLDNRVWFDASWFKTLTTDLITRTTPSVASGATGFLTNIGKLTGDGIELTLGANIIRSNNFKWDLNTNYTSYKTIVDEIYEGLDEVAVATYSSGQVGVFAIKDMSFPQIKANAYMRDPQGRIVIDPATGFPRQLDAIIPFGSTIPKHIVGLNSTVGFKGFNISATMDYRTGHVYYEQGSDAMEFTGRSLASVSSNRQDFVIPNSVIETSPGVFVENTNIPISGGRQSYWTDVYGDVKENYIKDATALKLRELTASFDLPTNWVSRTPIKKLSLGFIGRNLFTWLPAENHFSDPEFNNTNSNAIGVGGYFQGPPTKSYGFNLKIEF